MKKIFTTVIIVLGFYGLTSAQVKEKGDTEFGVEAGLNTSYVTSGDGYQNTAATAGFNAGVSGDFYFSNRWSLKVKVLYDQKGWNNGSYILDDNGSQDYKLNYITIPVLANWHFGRQRNWYLDFGPYVGILTGATNGSQDFKDEVNSTDIGLRVDIGVKIPISNNAKFFIELGGQGGATNIAKDSGSSSLQNETSSINVGINF